MLGLSRRQPQYRLGQPAKVIATRSNKLSATVPEALTAAGQRVDRGEASNLRRLIMPWQMQALGYYEQLGEIWYAAQFYSRMLSPLRLYPAFKDDNGELVETDNPDAVDALERIQDPGGGRTGMLGAYGRLMFLTGEALLLCSLDPETGLEQWEMLSTDELRIMDGILVRYKAPSLQAMNYRPVDDKNAWAPLTETQAIPYRLWRKHPRFSALADAPMRGVLELCEELLLLTRAVRARARSRTAGSGILFLDGKITTLASEPVGDEDPLEDLTLAMTASIADEGNPSSVVPLLARVEVPDGRSVRDMVYHLQIVDPMQLYPETGLRRECIDRIAIGLDMPPEALTGTGDVNHWSAWQIDEQTWKGHGQPVAQQLCDDITASYYRLELKQRGVADWQRYQVAYDASAIINHPDRTKDAKDLHDRGVIGDATLRDAGGFGEDDAQTPEERATWLAIKLRVAQSFEAIPGLTGELSAEVEKGAPEQPDDTTESTLPPPGENVIGAAAARVIGAADLAMYRAREAAGNRLCSLAKRDPDVLDELRDVRTGQVASVLGRERARALGAPTDLELVAGIRDLFSDLLPMFGIHDTAIVESIGDSLEKYAARTLYDERPASLPPQLVNLIMAGVRLNGKKTPAGV